MFIPDKSGCSSPDKSGSTCQRRPKDLSSKGGSVRTRRPPAVGQGSALGMTYGMRSAFGMMCRIKRKMRVLVIGSGGREHAIVWKLAQSRKVEQIFVAPGNDGMKELANRVDITEIKDIINLVRNYGIDLTIVGPEQPLADGIVDEFQKLDLKIIGPTKSAAEIGTSKAFAKNFMRRYNIPTPDFCIFDDIVEAIKYIRNHSYPLIIKADGLAGGKGVSIVDNYTSAEILLNQMMHQDKFGEAGKRAVIEEYLQGEEASIFAFTDGKHFVTTVLSKNYKPINDNNQGPNTDGMGAYAPAVYPENLKEDIDKSIILPTIQGLKKENRLYKGILYAGLMITDKGPKVLEFNCRLGDPEAEVILPLLKNDFIDICQAIISNKIDQIELHWKDKYSVAVVLASEGYPFKYEVGKEIKGLENVEQDQNNIIFFAGVEKEDNRFYTNGGRVMAVTSVADTPRLADAVKNCYQNIKKISFQGMYYRTDIAKQR